MMTTLQSSLIAWRSERKLSQAQAARITGFSLNTWKNWEYGRRDPGSFKTQAILRTLAECQPTPQSAVEAFQRDNDKAIQAMVDKQNNQP